MSDNTNAFGVSKKTLAMQLYEKLIDEDAVTLEEYSVERFIKHFEEVFRDYGLFLKCSMIE